MEKYSIHLSEYTSPNTQIPVFNLYVDGVCLFDEFYNKIEREGNLIRYVHAAISIVESAANGIRLHQTKFKEITPKGLPCKLYEAKKEDIRIYLFHEEKTGRIIVTGGKKSTQQKDINKIIKTVKAYYNEK
jgi:hypothetical protein